MNKQLAYAISFLGIGIFLIVAFYTARYTTNSYAKEIKDIPSNCKIVKNKTVCIKKTVQTIGKPTSTPTPTPKTYQKKVQIIQ